MTIRVLSSRRFVLEIRDQGGDGGVEFLNQAVLIENAFVVDVPAGAVEEVEIVGDFDETHSAFHEAPTEQAALTKLAAVEVAQACGFLVDLESAVEPRAAELQALFDGRVVVEQTGVRGGICVFFQLGKKGFATGLSGRRNAIGARQTGRAFAGIGQVEKSVLRAEKEPGPRVMLG